MSPRTDELEIKDFDEVANDHRSWRNTARSLLQAANTLKERNVAVNYPNGIRPKEPHHVPPYIGTWPELMLDAFAIECLLKGLWVKSGQKIARDGKLIKQCFPANHDLVAMLQKVGAPSQPRQLETLRRLSVIAEAVARYPIASDWRKTSVQQSSNGTYSPLSWSSGDQAITESCIEWLLAQLQR